MYTNILLAPLVPSSRHSGSELLRDIGFVVFDEVHYMQDRERGVVWEEAIIFMPKHTRMVFLSATLSNASEFAKWVAHLHCQPCHVVFTEYRPTPLQHYAFPQGGGGLFMVRPRRRCVCGGATWPGWDLRTARGMSGRGS